MEDGPAALVDPPIMVHDGREGEADTVCLPPVTCKIGSFHSGYFLDGALRAVDRSTGLVGRRNASPHVTDRLPIATRTLPSSLSPPFLFSLQPCDPKTRYSIGYIFDSLPLLDLLPTFGLYLLSSTSLLHHGRYDFSW